jgi:hypothetical protein
MLIYDPALHRDGQSGTQNKIYTVQQDAEIQCYIILTKAGKISNLIHKLLLFSEDEIDLSCRRKAFTRLYLCPAA